MNMIRPPSQPLPPATLALARRTIDRLVAALVPRSADFCLVHVIARGSIRAVAGAHATPDGLRVLRSLMRSYRISPQDGASGVASVIRTGRPLLRTAIQIDAAVAHRRDARALELHRQLAPRSALVVPIQTPVGIAGAMTL